MQLIATLIHNNTKENIILDNETGITWNETTKEVFDGNQLLKKFILGELSWVEPPQNILINTDDIYVFDAEKYRASENCIRFLYLDKYKSQLAVKSSGFVELLFDEALKIKKIAHKLYPNGKYILGLPLERAAEDTKQALIDNEPILYGATFIQKDKFNFITRIPILLNGNTVIFPIMSSKIQKKNIQRFSYIYWLLQQNNIEITSFICVHPNKEYRFNETFNVEEYFSKVEIIEDIKKEFKNTEENLEKFKKINKKEKPPKNLSSNCNNNCKYKDHCFDNLPLHNIFTLPRITASKKTLALLKDNNILEIKDIPDSISLSEKQEKRKQAVLTNNFIVTQDAKKILTNLPKPIHFIDFETLPMAVPRFNGMKPHQHLPFQWSNHIMLEDNTIKHEEYLDTTGLDCRQKFLETLIESCKTASTIMVYSSFEKTKLNELLLHFPEYKHQIDSLINKFFDLEKFIYNHVEHPDFMGRTSIKKVLPALYGEDLYKGLNVGNGTDAIFAYSKLIEDPNPSEKEKLRKDLLKYCELDTEAMVIIYNKLLNVL